MTTIVRDAPYVTLINLFTVEPAKQQQLVDLLVEATHATMKDSPGFISANLHKSLDGTRVVNYAQWRSEGDFQAMLKNPKARAHMQEASALAKSYDPNLYAVAEVCELEPSRRA